MGKEASDNCCCFCYVNVCLLYANLEHEIKQFTFAKALCIPLMQEPDGASSSFVFIFLFQSEMEATY